MVKDIIRREAQAVYKWARRFCDDEELSCWCAICSYEIFKRLRRAFLKPIFYQVSKGCVASHCFVLCQGYIVDVTARQFTRAVQNIEVVKPNGRGNHYWFWETDSGNPDLIVHTASTTQQIKRLMKGWPKYQNPFRVDFQKDWA